MGRAPVLVKRIMDFIIDTIKKGAPD